MHILMENDSQDCSTCKAVGTVREIRSPQPDDKGGVEYVVVLQCTCCGVLR